MKHVTLASMMFGLVLTIPAGATQAAGTAGLTILNIPVAHHNRAMAVSVMYPASGGTDAILGENPVFFGTRVRENAKPAPGKHPVILFSHGWGGNYIRMGWLTAGLAARGAIIISVNHPNSTTRDIQFQSALNHWTRAQDLSAALDYVLQDPALAASIDATRIYAAGYSYGGWTALSIAGLRGRREGFEQYCKAAGDGSDFCRELRKEGVDIAAIDGVKYEASYKDRRVAAVAAIEPGLTWGLQASDTTGLDVPVMLIGLGEGKDRLEATDTSAAGSNFESLFPAANVELLAPAMHFTALGVCNPAGEAILIQENDDPVCTDPPGTNRQAVLDRIVTLLARHFGLD